MQIGASWARAAGVVRHDRVPEAARKTLGQLRRCGLSAKNARQSRDKRVGGARCRLSSSANADRPFGPRAPWRFAVQLDSGSAPRAAARRAHARSFGIGKELAAGSRPPFLSFFPPPCSEDAEARKERDGCLHRQPRGGRRRITVRRPPQKSVSRYDGVVTLLRLPPPPGSLRPGARRRRGVQPARLDSRAADPTGKIARGQLRRAGATMSHRTDPACGPKRSCIHLSVSLFGRTSGE
jgi:hypothetical protein